MSPRAALAALCLVLVAACAPGAPAPTPGNVPPAAPGAGAGASPALVDRSCTVAADCVVKNVGNCCGYQPACVNRDAPVDPDAVRAACERSGMASVCGWQDIQACDCVQGRCEAVHGTIGVDR